MCKISEGFGDEEDQNLELKEHVQTLISLRKKHKVLANDSDILFVPHDSEVVLYKREGVDSIAYVCINLGKEAKTISLDEWEKATPLYTDSESKWNDHNELTLAKNGFSILSITK